MKAKRIPAMAIGKARSRKKANVVCVPGIKAPLPDVADDIVKTPRVRLLATYRNGVSPTVVLKPGKCGEFGGRITEVILSG